VSARAPAGELRERRQATPGLGKILPPPGSQDLRLDDAAGLIIVVDYADRWPLSHLTWLFSNSVASGRQKVRFVLIARTAAQWSVLTAAIERRDIALSVKHLAPLPTEEVRKLAYTTAVEAFSRIYETDFHSAHSMVDLSEPGYDTALGILLRALVNVDARVHGLEVPNTQVAFTRYLLNRERQHWTLLYEHGIAADGLEARRLDFATSPSVMEKAVFIAALTGELSYSDGEEILNRAERGTPASRILQDHAACYPTARPGAGAVLSPLYPDRLAEDFLAFTLVGAQPDHAGRPWAVSILQMLLVERPGEHPASWMQRAITFLLASAERWTELQPTVYQILEARPEVASLGGNETLLLFSNLPALPIDVLLAVYQAVPKGSDPDLDVGVAAVTRLVTDYLLKVTDDPAEKAALLSDLGELLERAGLWDEAFQRTSLALDQLRQLGGSLPAETARQYARTLNVHSINLKALGRNEEALAASEEALGIQSQLWERLGLADDASAYARSLSNLGLWLLAVGRREAALDAVRAAVETRRGLVEVDRAAYSADLAQGLSNLGLCLAALGKGREALDASREALKIFGDLSTDSPAKFAQNVARSLTNTAADLIDSLFIGEGLVLAKEAALAHRRLSSQNFQAFAVDFARTLMTLSIGLGSAGLHQESVDAAAEAVDVMRRFRKVFPATDGRELASALTDLANSLMGLGRWEEATSAANESLNVAAELLQLNTPANLDLIADATGSLALCAAGSGDFDTAIVRGIESVRVRELLAQAYPERYLPDLGKALGNLGACLQAGNRWDESADIVGRLLELSVELQRLGKAVENVILTRSAVRLSREISTRGIRQDDGWLAASLDCLSVALLERGRPSDSLLASTEAVSLFEPTVAASFAIRAPRLVNMLVNQAAALVVLTRSSEARAPAARATTVCREYCHAVAANDRQPIPTAGFLAQLLDQLGMPEDAEWVRLLEPGNDG
jgi:tetratricopeptide (TPR) repeat protein